MSLFRSRKEERNTLRKYKSYLSYHFLFLHKPNGIDNEPFRAVVLGHTSAALFHPPPPQLSYLSVSS